MLKWLQRINRVKRKPLINIYRFYDCSLKAQTLWQTNVRKHSPFIHNSSQRRKIHVQHHGWRACWLSTYISIIQKHEGSHTALKLLLWLSCFDSLHPWKIQRRQIMLVSFALSTAQEYIHFKYLKSSISHWHRPHAKQHNAHYKPNT